MRRFLASTLAAGVVLVVAPAAHAATRDLTDPSGDVMTGTTDSDGFVVKYNREGGAEGDITFTRIQHTATQVIVYIRYAQLSVPRQYGGLETWIEGNNGQRVRVDIETRHGDPQGEATAFNEKTSDDCRLGYRINYAGDSFSMRIPRSCLQNPKYIRLMHDTAETVGAREMQPSKIYYDSPTRDGGTINQVFSSRSPWVVTG